MSSRLVTLGIAVLLSLSLMAACAKPAPTPAPPPAQSPAAKPSPSPTASAAPAPKPSPSPSPAAAAPIKWRAQTGITMTSYMPIHHFKPFVDMVNERARGRLVIELFAPGAIIDAYGQFGAVQKGVMEMGMGIGGYNISQVPEADIEQGLPATFTTLDQSYDFFMNYKDGAFYKLANEAYQAKGAYLLKSFAPTAFALMLKKPIKSIDEVKGKKLRGSGAYTELMKNLGAAPVQLAPAELYMALQTGTIDGLAYASYAIGTMKFWDVAKCFVKPDLGPSMGQMYASKKAFEALPKDLQEIVIDSAAKAAFNGLTQIKKNVNEQIALAEKEHGVQIVTLSDADVLKVRKAGESVMTDMAKMSPIGAKMVDVIREYLSAQK